MVTHEDRKIYFRRTYQQKRPPAALPGVAIHISHVKYPSPITNKSSTTKDLVLGLKLNFVLLIFIESVQFVSDGSIVVAVLLGVHSSHGAVRPLQLQILNDERRATLHYLRRYLAERTVLNAHYLEAGAQSELERQVVQHQVVVDVQTLERLQGADLLRQVAEVVLAHTQVGQIFQVPNSTRQGRQLVALHRECLQLLQKTDLRRQPLQPVLLKVQSAELAQVADRTGNFLQQIIGKSENLEIDETGDVIGHLGELVGAQVQFYHVGPRADVEWQGGEGVILHVQLSEVLRPGKDAIWDLVNSVVLEVNALHIGEL